MTKTIKPLIAIFFLAVLSITACKRAVTELDYTTELANHSDDQNQFSAFADEVADDINASLDGYAAFSGRTDNTLALPCNATAVLDSTATLRRLTITYNGANCAGTRTRTGVVVLTIPLNTRWKDVGAVLTVNINTLKITRVADGKYITLNGTKTITNVSGGLLRNLAALGTITHTIASSNMSITFADGSQRNWNVAKKRVFTYNNGVIITTTGNTTVDGLSNVSEWGTNRAGNAFVTSITQPMVVRQDCSFRLTAGQVTHNKMAATAVVTFGLDANGNATTCPSGNYYFKLVWTGSNGIVRTLILAY